MQLQAIERALARQRRALAATLRLKLAQQCAKDRIVTQLLVIVEILIAQRDPKYALADQRPDRCSIKSGSRSR